MYYMVSGSQNRNALLVNCFEFWVLRNLFWLSSLQRYLMTPNTSMRELTLMGKYCPSVAITLGLISDECMSEVIARWRYDSADCQRARVGQLVMDAMYGKLKLAGDGSSLYIWTPSSKGCSLLLQTQGGSAHHANLKTRQNQQRSPQNRKNAVWIFMK